MDTVHTVSLCMENGEEDKIERVNRADRRSEWERRGAAQEQGHGPRGKLEEKKRKKLAVRWF